MSGKIRRRAGANVSELQDMVASGQQGAYEALQLYRSKVNRLVQKQQFEEARTICVQATLCLLKHGYGTAGAEIANVYVDLLSNSGEKLNIDVRNTINEIDRHFQPKSQERCDFLKKCIKLSIATGDRELGDPVLNTELALLLWDTDNRSKSVLHFVIGESPEKLWMKINETYSTPDTAQDRDRMVTQGVVQYLSFENIRDANILLSCLKKEDCVQQSQLITFCTQLLQVCLRDAAPLYKTLCNVNYEALLTCDPVVQTSLQGPIALKLFDIHPPPNILSMFENMLGGL
eukprot:gene6783-13738_t